MLFRKSKEKKTKYDLTYDNVPMAIMMCYMIMSQFRKYTFIKNNYFFLFRTFDMRPIRYASSSG